jgi:ankyrin repeat protein
VEKDATDDEGKTALHWAAIEGHKSIVEVLLGSGANKELRDNGWWTPLRWAMENDKTDVVKLLE